MKFHVLTLFPEMIEQCCAASILGRAQTKGQISVNATNIRDYAENKHGHVDDYPYGGGAGMVMQAGPICRAFEDVTAGMEGETRPRVIYVTPQGQVFSQKMAQELAQEEDLVILCGHYEGVDERALTQIGAEPVSIGDYVLTGGELPALVMIDAIARLVPGVLNNSESAEDESFSDGLLEYPPSTRPEIFRGEKYNVKKADQLRGLPDPLSVDRDPFGLAFSEVHIDLVVDFLLHDDRPDMCLFAAEPDQVPVYGPSVGFRRGQ